MAISIQTCSIMSILQLYILDDGMRNLAAFSFVFIGGLGNLLTLIAIPYVRTRYRQEFSILQLNSVILLLHLSFVDFLFALVWIFYNLEVSNLRKISFILNRNELQVYFWEGAGEGSLCFLRGIAIKLSKFLRV